MSKQFTTACKKSEVLSEDFIDTVMQEILKVFKRKIMKYHTGIQHFNYFSLEIPKFVSN